MVITMKQKVGIIVKSDGKVISKTNLSVNEFSGKEILRELYQKQVEDDILHLGSDVVYPDSVFGIKAFVNKGSVISTENLIDADRCETTNDNMCSYVIGSSTSVNNELSKISSSNEPVIVKGNKVFLSFIMYRTGFVIGTGKNCTSIFGTTNKEAFVKTFGKSNFHGASIENCRTFDSFKKAYDYLEKNKESAKFLVKKYGYCFNVKAASEGFSSDLTSELLSNSNKRDKVKKERELLDSLIKDINSVITDDSELFQYPEISEGIATEDEQFLEALLRLRALRDMDIVANALRQGKVYVSRYNGMLYDPNDEISKDIKELQSKGIYVYHVIETVGTINDDSPSIFRDYLCVSSEKSEWAYERPDGKYNMIDSYCKSTYTYENFEIGAIYISTVNGGLRRLSDNEVRRKVG